MMILENNNRKSKKFIHSIQNTEGAHFGWDQHVRIINHLIQKILISKDEDVMEQYENRILRHIKEKVLPYNKNYPIYKEHINILREKVNEIKKKMIHTHVDEIINKYNMQDTSLFLDKININIFKKDSMEKAKENFNRAIDIVLDEFYSTEEQYQTYKKEQDFAILNLMDYMEDGHEGFLSYRFINRPILLLGQKIRKLLKKEYKIGEIQYRVFEKTIIQFEENIIQLGKN